jgi:hypothetical protein
MVLYTSTISHTDHDPLVRNLFDLEPSGADERYLASQKESLQALP